MYTYRSLQVQPVGRIQLFITSTPELIFEFCHYSAPIGFRNYQSSGSWLGTTSFAQFTITIYIPGFEFSSYREPHFSSELVFSPSPLGFTPTLHNFFTRPLPASLSLPPPSPAGLLSLELLEFSPYFSPISPELELLNWCIYTSPFVPVSESLLVLCVHWGQLSHAVHKAALS